jgi:monoamine oxidase
MRETARVVVTEAQDRLGGRIIGKLHRSEVGTKIGSVTGRVIAVCVVSAAPNIVTHFVPLSGVR